MLHTVSGAALVAVAGAGATRCSRLAGWAAKVPRKVTTPALVKLNVKHPTTSKAAFRSLREARYPDDANAPLSTPHDLMRLHDKILN